MGKRSIHFLLSRDFLEVNFCRVGQKVIECKFYLFHDGDEDGEHDQDRMIQQTLKAPPETQDICLYFLSVDLFFSEIDLAAMLSHGFLLQFD